MKFWLLQKESRTSRNANYQALVGYAIEQITAPAAVVYCCRHIKRTIKEKLFISASAEIINTSPESDSTSCAAVNSCTLLAILNCPAKVTVAKSHIHFMILSCLEDGIIFTPTGCAEPYKSKWRI